MKVTVRYFAALREAAGQGSETLETQAATVGGLRAQLGARPGALAALLAPDQPVRMALDQVVCPPEAMLHEGAEVAFFPPVTGG